MSKKPKTEETQDVVDVLKKEEEVQATIEEKKNRQFFYWIRPKLNAEDTIGLSKYGKSKWSGCVELIHPAYDERSKKWLTGLDEYDPTVLTLKTQSERTKRQEEIKELRESLERMTGENLSPTNDEFWSKEILSFSENTKPLTPYINARDRIKVEWLKRRGDVPFGNHDLYNPKYMDAKFYIETEDESINKRKSAKNLQKEALAASYNLENEHDKLWKICSLLNINKAYNISTESLINKLDEWIERNKKYPDTIESLIELNKKTLHELEGLTVLQLALDFNLVNWDGRSKCYYRGGTTFGSTKDEAVKFLSDPENGHIFVEIKNAVDNKKRNHRGLQ